MRRAPSLARLLSVRTEAFQAAKGEQAMPHVLLVEDELQLRRILTLNLTHGGYSVAEADSVETAFDMILAAREVGVPFDLIVIETHLPDRCGWELLRMLRPTLTSADKRPVDPTPVVVISPISVSASRLAEFAPAAALLKPFPIEALLRLIARAQRPDFGRGLSGYSSLRRVSAYVAHATSNGGAQLERRGVETP